MVTGKVQREHACVCDGDGKGMGRGMGNVTQKREDKITE